MNTPAEAGVLELPCLHKISKKQNQRKGIQYPSTSHKDSKLHTQIPESSFKAYDYSFRRTKASDTMGRQPIICSAKILDFWISSSLGRPGGHGFTLIVEEGHLAPS